jgi:hypothetical protein
VIFSRATRSGCGAASAQMGPFYCPRDQTVYIDLTFFQEMQQKFRAGGDFAYAYVIAHEVGHHVENQLGILGKVQARQQEVGQAEANQLSVRVELMADCLAGLWAFHSNQRWKSLEEGDIQEAMNAAAAIGDDRLQMQAQGYAIPDSFTHGTSEQRMRWFMTGMKGGQVQQCDTFRRTGSDRPVPARLSAAARSRRHARDRACRLERRRQDDPLAKLIPEFNRRGLSVSTVKHAHHAFEIDRPGKDSFEHRRAGASEVLIASARRWALVRELRGQAEPSLADLPAPALPRLTS